LDVDLLTALCNIQGKSGDEGDMQEFITLFLQAHGLDPQSDANGNITCTKGEAEAYPCMVAHMDTVHTSYIGYQAALSDDGQVLYAYAPTVAKYEPAVVKENLSKVFSGAVTKETGNVQCGVGGDDRCGIYVALHLLTRLPAMKVCFVVEEEIGGGKGSGFVNMRFFDDCAVVLQCDRKGHEDWVQSTGTKLAGDDFIASIADLLALHAYKPYQHGGFTDVVSLKQRGLGVCAANMSCGYYNPHSSTETIFLPALENTLNLCAEVLARVGYVKQLHAHVPYEYKSNYAAGSSAGNTRWSRPAHTTYKKAQADPFGTSFIASEYGWDYISAEKLNTQHGMKDVKMGGWCKTVEGKLLGPYEYQKAKDYERERAENAALVKAGEDAAKTKELRKELKKWVEEDGSWLHNKLSGPKAGWVKWISDGGENDTFYPVAYAKLMVDIPAAEKEFQHQWEGCYGPDVDESMRLNDGSVMFTAESISKHVHEVLAEQAETLRLKESRGVATQHQLPFDTDDKVEGEYDEISYTTKNGLEYTTTKTYRGGKLVSTSVSSQPVETLDDLATVACPSCDTPCIPAHALADDQSFYCATCHAWKDKDDDEEDQYSRYLGHGSEHGNWRESQDAYERAYGRD
jgi:hypothetical protein